VRAGESSTLLTDSRPDSDYVDNGDGTITYTATGLTWKRCAEGQTWTGSTCIGAATSYTWDQQTRTLSSSFAGFNDWRVPSEDELISLVDYTLPWPGPTLNTKWFPNAPVSSFWSASVSATTSGYTWYVNFGYGYPGYSTPLIANSFQVRLVRVK